MKSMRLTQNQRLIYLASILSACGACNMAEVVDDLHLALHIKPQTTTDKVRYDIARYELIEKIEQKRRRA